MPYTWYIHEICCTYSRVSNIQVLPAFKGAMDVGGSQDEYKQHGIFRKQTQLYQKVMFYYKTGYTRNIPGHGH